MATDTSVEHSQSTIKRYYINCNKNGQVMVFGHHDPDLTRAVTPRKDRAYFKIYTKDVLTPWVILVLFLLAVNIAIIEKNPVTF